jgi:hypothetical protein
MNRKITQITVTGNEEGEDTLYALCDDGSVWVLFIPIGGPGKWLRLPDMPQ